MEEEFDEKIEDIEDMEKFASKYGVVTYPLLFFKIYYKIRKKLIWKGMVKQ